MDVIFEKCPTMSGSNWCPDNFFKKMTDLESPRKNNDCYFYYYSKCAKGDSCTFRHEPSALGCETMCSFWKEGKCMNVHCNFRHMELRKNRKAIPCYWESQPGGCLKPHCPFMHASRAGNPDESLESKTDSGTESADNTMNEKMTQMSELVSLSKTPVDSLVVNFEEESDNESAPTTSPAKTTNPTKTKTLEELKLEQIQLESAAYYSYPASKLNPITTTSSSPGDDLRQRLKDVKYSKKRVLDHPVACDKNKRAKVENVADIKIKTLEEIRAERAKKMAETGEKPKRTIDVCDSSVTSTCGDDVVAPTVTVSSSQQQQRRKVKLQRGQLFASRQETTHLPQSLVISDINEDLVTKVTENSPNFEQVKSPTEALDEVLLLQDDDDNSNVSLKEEEELLNDSDELMD